MARMFAGDAWDDSDDEYSDDDIDDEDEKDDDEDDEPSAWERGDDEDDDFPDEEDDEDNQDIYRAWESGDSITEENDPFASLVFPDTQIPSLVPPDNEGSLDAYYDPNGYYAYVLLRRRNGELTDLDRTRVEKALRSVNVSITRNGASYQPASDGTQYQWYFRVKSTAQGKPEPALVNGALNPFRASESRLNRTPALNTELIQRLTSAERDLRHARNNLAETTARHEQSTLQHRATEDDLVARIRQMLDRARLHVPREEYDELCSQLELTGIRLDEERHRADQASSEQREYEETFDVENSRLRAENAQIKAQLHETIQEHDRLEAELMNALDDRAAASVRVKPRDVLLAALPSVEFLQGSLDLMFKEMRDYEPVLTLIGSIATYGECYGQKKLTDVGGWMEAHFRTGESDDGRLYFCRKTSSGWAVLVDRKQNQRKRIAYLRSMRL